MVSRAASTCSNSTSPSRTSASAECSSCVLPRSARNCSRAPARSCRLGETLRAAAPASGRRRAPTRPGSWPRPLRPCARQQRAPQRRRRGACAAASIARSSISAGRDLDRNAGGLQHLAAHFALEASTSGRPESQSGMAHRSSRRLPAAFGQQPHHRRGGLLDRAARHVDRSASCAWRTAGARTRSPRPPPPVDVLVVVAMRVQAEQPVLRGSARCAPGWRKARPPAAASASRPPAAPARPAPAAHFAVFTPRLAR